MASRMAARSTTAGTPVKSCMRTRAGRKAISRVEVLSFSHSTTARMSSALVTERPSSKRSRFSISTLSEKGSLEMPARPFFSASGSEKYS